MKKYTAKEIAEYLASSGTAFEWEGDEARYYIHYRDGQLVSSKDGSDFTTWARDRYLEGLWSQLLEEAKAEYTEEVAEEKALEKFENIAWTTETAESPELLSVAQELADELNDYRKNEEHGGRVTLNGVEFFFDDCYAMMDSDITWDLNLEMPMGYTGQEFLDEYCKKHFDKYHEEFKMK